MKHVLRLSPLLLLGATAPTSPVTRIDYALTPDITGGAIRSLIVEARFTAGATGIVGFGWQRSWGGSATLGRYARDFAVDGASSITADGDRHFRIVARPGAALTVRYRVVSGYDAYPALQDFERAVPVIRPTWFTALGYDLFGFPDDSQAWPATFAWTKAPKDMVLVSDLQHLPTRATEARPLGTVDDVLHSTLVGGSDLSVYDDSRGSGLRIAALPAAVQSTDALYRLSRQIAGAERTFWNDSRPRPYVITASPVPRKPGSRYLSGANFGDAFGLWLNADAAPVDIAYLLAHEYGHNWIPGTLGHTFEVDGQEQREAWLGEGFTDYFALAIALRSGAIDVRDFLDLWNGILLQYAISPARNMPGDAAATAFFTNAFAEKLPYPRGAMLAARWAQQLRAHGNKTDLRRILLAQMRVARGSVETPAPLFVKTAKSQGLVVADDIKRFVVQGETIMLAPDTFGPCATVVTERRPAFERGYDAEATAASKNTVVGVVPGSAAYRAGLRNGMTIQSRKAGKPGDSMTPFTLVITNDGTVRELTYLPQGKSMQIVQQIRPLRRFQGCRKSISGLS